ncbi:MAG TPA: hypothetical protein PKE55_09700 [Kiritimatiellia bacterium]|nr:hypothetical protein [Kiritimatiellia bacterium]
MPALGHLVILLCLMAGYTLAAGAPSTTHEKSEPAPQPATGRVSGILTGANLQQQRASGWVKRTATRLDRFFFNLSAPSHARRNATFDHFFDDRGLDSSEQDTVLRLSPGITVKEGEGTDASFRFSLRLHLPRFENQADLVIANFGQDDTVDDTFRTGRFSDSLLEEETDRSISLRATVRETRRLRLSLSTGVNFRPEPVPTLAARLRLEEREGIHVRRLTPALFWDQRDGLGQNARLDFERHPSPEWKQRASTFLLWSETSEGIKASETLSWIHAPSRRRVQSLHLGATGKLEPSTIMTAYIVRYNFYRLIYKNWVYLEVEPGVQFPRERDWETTPFVNIQLHVLLGAVR